VCERDAIIFIYMQEDGYMPNGDNEMTIIHDDLVVNATCLGAPH
jgi:hypothetical protein